MKKTMSRILTLVLVLAMLVAVQNYVKGRKAANGQPVPESSCGQGCAACGNASCSGKKL